MALDSSSPSSYAFHGSNSSHSKDNRSGGRTYHIPNYATNYTNERSNLITVSLNDGKGLSKIIVAAILVLLLVAAVPMAMITSRFWQLPKDSPDHSVAWTGGRENDQATRVQAPTMAITQGVLVASTAHPVQSQDSIDDSIRRDEKTSKPKWEGITPDEHCHSYGKKGHTARLYNLSVFSNWSKTCRNTAITIQDQRIAEPISCESSWPFGGVKGRWLVSVDDSACRPHWGEYHDEGCVKGIPRRRRFSAPLKGMKKAEDAMGLCTSAPATIQGRKIEHPRFCEKKGMWLWASIEGVWEVEDHSCH